MASVMVNILPTGEVQLVGPIGVSFVYSTDGSIAVTGSTNQSSGLSISVVDGGSAGTQLVLIKLRRDTAANWISANPILNEGEPGFEIDTGKLKIGDGSTAWLLLTYV